MSETSDEHNEWKEDYRRKKHKEPMAELVRDYLGQKVIEPKDARIAELEARLTRYNHPTIRPNVVKGYEHMVTPDMHNVAYLRSEYEIQVDKMKGLGIPVEQCFFEQSVNAVIDMVERLEAENKALKGRIDSLLGEVKAGIDLLDEARFQLEYLDHKFSPTGTTANVLSRIKTFLEIYHKQQP